MSQWFYSLFSGLLIVSALTTKACPLQKLTYITEDYPPHNFMEEGVLQGISVDLLLAALAAIDCPILKNDIKMMPWTRGYYMALNQPDIVLFGMTRIKERENLFKWAGPYMNSQIGLTARKDAYIKAHNLNDLNRLTIGVVKDDVAEKLFKGIGINSPNFKYGNNHPETLAKMLVSYRFDAWGYEINVARWMLIKLGYNINDFETVYTFPPIQSSYAFSKNTPDSTVKLLQTALDKIKNKKGKTGNTLLNEIYTKYGVIN
ncbi:substrate-binding periplasmic protein [Spartinivicinus ruber]|uniref:substrate-binding periplasmic protein n=1 Tax=Spartinivicinus ruber TaxID=2683272 RepID=UPI0013D2FEEE|nr:transporter substrate-binding domain-containing protein [Spartinivicinus ruber]